MALSRHPDLAQTSLGICPSFGCENDPVTNQDDRAQRVRIRRAPKFSVFLVLGALLGIFVSLVLTASFPIDPTVGFGPTFGYFAIYGFVGGLLLGSIVALVFDRALGRSTKTVSVTVDRLQVPDQEPAADSGSSGAADQ
jgi:hypothetical protein